MVGRAEVLNHLVYVLSVLQPWLNPASLTSGRMMTSITMGAGGL